MKKIRAVFTWCRTKILWKPVMKSQNSASSPRNAISLLSFPTFILFKCLASLLGILFYSKNCLIPTWDSSKEVKKLFEEVRALDFFKTFAGNMFHRKQHSFQGWLDGSNESNPSHLVILLRFFSWLPGKKSWLFLFILHISHCHACVKNTL